MWCERSGSFARATPPIPQFSDRPVDFESPVVKSNVMRAAPLSQQQALASLKKRWWGFIAYGVVVLAVGGMYFSGFWQPLAVLRWLLLSGLVFFYISVLLWNNLDQNRSADGSVLLPDFGAGNIVTLFRAGLIAILCGCLFSPRLAGSQVWTPALVYMAAVVADIMDGYLARRTNHVTRLGGILDMELDGLGMLVITSLAVQYEQVPRWYVLVGLARYLFLAGSWLRQRWGLPVYELSPSLSRRLIAGLQMGFMAIILWPVFRPPGTILAALAFGLPFLAGFLKDWLLVSGVLKPGFGRSYQRIQKLCLQELPVLLRMVSAGLLIVDFFSYKTGPAPSAIQFILEALAVILLCAGAAGRVAAVLGLCLLGFFQNGSGLSLPLQALVFIYTALLYLGTGALSIWKPEERLFVRRAEERE